MGAWQDLWSSLQKLPPSSSTEKLIENHTFGWYFVPLSLSDVHGSLYIIPLIYLYAYPLYSHIVRELCFKVKCLLYAKVYREQSSSQFITSRRQSSFCRAPWQHGIALFPPAFVGGCQATRDKVHCLHKHPANLTLYESEGLTCQKQLTNLRSIVTVWIQPKTLLWRFILIT